ncbi:MAG: DUF885 domain-containing protein [Eubacteriales bacterium]
MNTKSSGTIRRILLAIMILSLIMTATFSSSCFLVPVIRQVAGDLAGKSESSDASEASGSAAQSETSGEAGAIQALKDIDFEMFADSVTSDTLTLHFSVKDPAALNLTVPPTTFGDVSKEKSDETIAGFVKYQDELAKIDYGMLPEQYHVMYDVIKSDLKEGIDYQKYYYYSSPFNSITGLQTELPLVLSEYTFAGKEDIDQYLLLLSDLDRYYSDLMVFEKDRADKGLGASDANLQKVIDSCSSFLADKENHFLISSFAERLDTVKGLTDAEKADYIAQNQSMLDTHVFPAYQILIDGFTALMGTGVNAGGLCNLPGGKAYYSLLLKSDTSSDSSVNTVSKQIEQAISDEMDIIKSAPTDSAFSDAYANYNFSEGTIQQNLDYCEAAIAADFPPIMSHKVTLKEVPSALEAFFSPAAYLSCPIDDPTDNVIVTNTAALAGYQNILETVAHEGYPGHMYEAIFHAQNISSYYQRTASFIGYSEGWAEYAAGYILSHSEYDQTLVSYIAAENQIINILLPSRIDIGVNYEAWSQEKVNNYVSGFGLNQDYADYCYNVAIEIPCYYMPYCVGHLNTDDIIANAKDKLGDSASLSEIHKAYLDIGPAPFQIVKKYMDIYVQNGQE